MTFLVRGGGCQEDIQAAAVRKIFRRRMSPQFMTLNIWDASGALRRFGNILSSVSCIKDEWQFRRLGRQYYRSLLFDCGLKWIQQIPSVWRAKLSGESELSAADALRVSPIKGSGHVWPGKLNRPPLPSGVKRRMWNIRRKWNVDRTEFRMWDIRRRWNVGQTEFFPGWNELCRASQGGPSACAREREPRGIFLGRIPHQRHQERASPTDH